MYKLFLTLRYLRSGVIAYFAIAAVALCTFLIIVVMSVMGGFLDKLKFKARGLLGDIVVDNAMYQGFPLYDDFIAEIKAWPEVVEATPVVYSYGLLRFPQTEQTALVRVVGIRLEATYRVNAFEESLFYQKYYPGTTHLGEQRQPRLGTADPMPVYDSDGRHEGDILRPVLFQPFRDALAQFCEAWRNAHNGEEFPGPDDATETPLDDFLREQGLPPIPGVFELNTETGEADETGNAYPGLIIGREIVAKRDKDGRYKRHFFYPRGCEVLLALLTSQFDTTAIKQPFRYADDSRTGIHEIDSQHVYCDFDLLQKLIYMDEAERAEGGGKAPARCSQIQVKIADGIDAGELSDRLQELYQSYVQDARLDDFERNLVNRIEAMTWEESQMHIIAPVEKERILVTILFGTISLVATVLTLCILYMIVMQKTRDIGIIKSIGGSSAGVSLIFVSYGAAIGIVGSVLGLVGGFYFVKYINEFQQALIWIHPALQVWDRSVYSFDEIPNTARTVDLIRVGTVAVVTSIVGAFAAARRAGTMHPVEALRYG